MKTYPNSNLYLFKTFLICICFILVCSFIIQHNFVSEQKKHARVKEAYSEKEGLIENNLKQYKLDKNNLNILMVAFKQEQELHIYGKNKTESGYKKIANYPICASSGVLGPKRKQGDGQVPEGFYYIDRFNPTSNYFLSLGVSYPNQSDKIKGNKNNLGGDIFIHGYCVTIGCMPMTNDKIKEIYIYATQARNSGQTKIPVYIFPFKMSEQNFSKAQTQYTNNSELLSFWKNLKTGHDKFYNTMKELQVSVSSSGEYLYK